MLKMASDMKKLKIGDLTAELPIIQGGMGVGISLSGLAVSVANEGGIGTISAVMPGFRETDLYHHYREANIRALQKEIRYARSKTTGILAVNIMVAITNYADMVKTAVSEGIDIIISGAGLPLKLPEYLNGSTRTKLVPIVSTARAAELIIKKWKTSYNYVPDALVLESAMSGGHQGIKAADINLEIYSLDNQLPEVLRVTAKYEQLFEKNIPVIVAGGVYTGADIRRYMEMGAAGAQLGTRFVTTHECDASTEFKMQYIACNDKERIVTIQSPVGLPLRVIHNDFIDKVIAGERKVKHCPYKCLHTCNYQEASFCIALALMNAQKGNISEGILCCGTNGYRNDTIVSVKELLATIRDEYNSL